MMFILLSVLLNSLLFVILKLFPKYNIDTLTALVVNYGTASFLGMMVSQESYSLTTASQSEWFTSSMLLGCLFISVFFATAITSQRNGLSVASVASKMSVIIPIGFGIFLFNEEAGFLKILGIILALIAVYYTSKKEEGTVALKQQLLFPALVFVGAGIIDSSLKIISHFYLSTEEIGVFSTNTFLMAFLIGLITLSIRYSKNKENVLLGKNILGGVVLGIPNYFALFYMIKMLDYDTWDSSTIFTIHNVAIVTLTTMVGLIIFREKITLKNAFGILLALFSIFLVTWK